MLSPEYISMFDFKGIFFVLNNFSTVLGHYCSILKPKQLKITDTTDETRKELAQFVYLYKCHHH